jgi:hypothetical protein
LIGSIHPGYLAPLPFAARNLYNAGLFYAGYGFKFSLAANFIDRNLAAAGSTPQTDQYYDKHFSLDLSVSYWLKDACERMSVATQVRISHYEPLRAPTRGRPVYAYRLYIIEVTKVDFLKRFERFLELAKAN